MSKFVIQCPKCGRYVEASTGFFSKKKIDCSCGYTIDVRTNKLSSKVCPNCGNTVVFDQSKGKNAQCPICHEKINLREDMAVLVEFTCPSCSCKISANKNKDKHTCPLCGTVIDIKERIAKENIKNSGAASVIKYEGENDVLVWKHPIEDYNLGSQLIVHESQEAIFVCDGRIMDKFGAGRYTLATKNIPLLENLYKLSSDNKVVFHSEVYFVNLVTQTGIKWGTDSKVRFFDPASGIHIEIGACGNFGLRVCNAGKLLTKIVGTASEFKQDEIMGHSYGVAAVVGKFKALVINKVKANIARIIRESNINILEIDEHIDVISEKLCAAINENLEEYGLTIPEFFVTSVVTPDDDANFRRLKQQFADKTLKVREEEIRKAESEAAQSRKIVEAQTEAQLKIVDAQGEAEAIKIRAQAEAEAYKARANAEAEEMRAKGYTYQQETSRMLGTEALKNKGAQNGAGVGVTIGDIAGLGITLGAAEEIIGITKEALSPTKQSVVTKKEDAFTEDVWTCSCGRQNITSKFCPDCGKKMQNATWNCTCGRQNITSKFCPDCGNKREDAK